MLMLAFFFFFFSFFSHLFSFFFLILKSYQWHRRPPSALDEPSARVAPKCPPATKQTPTSLLLRTWYQRTTVMKRFLFVVGGILLGILASNLLDTLMKQKAGACVACTETHVDTNDVPQQTSIPQVRVGHVYERLLDADKIDLLRWTVGTTMWWPAALIDFLLEEIANDKDISSRDYPQSAVDMEQALRMIGVKDKRVLVAGSTTPWVEAIALYLGASEVVTAGHRAPVCRECHPRLRTMDMNKALRVATPADYGVIVSYSAILAAMVNHLIPTVTYTR
jgi:hypothetical protein